jgi:hypothetical protein
MSTISHAVSSILPKPFVTGLSGSTSQYESKGGKAKKSKKGSKKAKKASKKVNKRSKKTAKTSRKWFPLLGF